MRRIILALLILFLLFPIKVDAFATSSECAILMDQDSGRIIYAKNIHRQRLIASITKIMTAVIAIESDRLDETVTVDETVLKSYGSNIYIEVGEKITLRDLVYGLMLKSGNDAAMMIAAYLSGSEAEFTKLMNVKVREIGMDNTIFNNSHGLDEETENWSTAYDMALLTRYAMEKKEYKKIVGTKKYVVKTNYKTYEWVNKNQLLFTNDYITGGKNGYTERAYRTLVTTSTKDNLNLIVVSLNDSNQWGNHSKLHEYGHEQYKNYKILHKKNFKVVDDYFYKDKLYIKNDYSYPLTEQEKEKVSVTVKIEKLNEYKNNEKVGELYLYLNNELIHVESIFVYKEEQKSNLLKRIINWFARLK
ncbi:MAG: D-alanyl-D-alanine carboxypeptidase [Bacilli bacterium]|nr:D-alanyl-D-alanine carboxypeptidase [Bacilli bacterium]